MQADKELVPSAHQVDGTHHLGVDVPTEERGLLASKRVGESWRPLVGRA